MSPGLTQSDVHSNSKCESTSLWILDHSRDPGRDPDMGTFRQRCHESFEEAMEDVARGRLIEH